MNPPMSGPTTLANAKTAPRYPWYFPRSRGATMSPMMAWASAMSPPAPAPCSARNATSSSMLCARPHSIEAIVKIARLARYRFLRPNRLASMPMIGMMSTLASM